MRNEYVKPEIAVENVIVESPMLSASVEITPEEKPMGANEHRGGWGDLWN